MTRGSLRSRRARNLTSSRKKKTLDLKRTRSRSRGGPHSSKKKEEAEEKEEESTKKERGKQPQKSILKTRNKNASSSGAKKKKEEEEEEEEEEDEEEEEEEEEKEIPRMVKEKDEEEDAEKQLPLVVAAPATVKPRCARDEMEEEEEEEEEEQGLFEWLAKKEKLPEEKANRLAAEWTTRYQEDQASAAPKMYTLLTKASGCKAKIYKPELMNSECAIIMKRIEDELRQGNVNPVDPMAGKGKLYRNFKDDLSLFMRAVVRETIDSRDLFDDTMFEMFREIFQTCSNSTARVMRVVATGMGLNVISGLVNACLSQSKQAALKQRQLDNALASRNEKKPR